MNRFFALIGALFLSFVTIASACAAVAPGSWTDPRGPKKAAIASRPIFAVTGTPELLQLVVRVLGPVTSLASTLPVSASGTRPLRFSLIRELGRIDCL